MRGNGGVGIKSFDADAAGRDRPPPRHRRAPRARPSPPPRQEAQPRPGLRSLLDVSPGAGHAEPACLCRLEDVRVEHAKGHPRIERLWRRHRLTERFERRTRPCGLDRQRRPSTSASGKPSARAGAYRDRRRSARRIDALIDRQEHHAGVERLRELPRITDSLQHGTGLRRRERQSLLRRRQPNLYVLVPTEWK